jgi:hypothetical protein
MQGMCPPTSRLIGTLLDISPISTRDEASVEALYQEEEAMAILDGVEV